MAEPIEMPFVGQRKHVLRAGAHWRRLASTTETSMSVSDVAFLSNYFDDLFCYCNDRLSLVSDVPIPFESPRISEVQKS